jgi:uncharacterized membrane protein YdbT with pleckstrin-like domain
MKLLEDEQLVWEGHPTWRAQFLRLVGFLLLAAVPLVFAAILAANDVGTGLPVYQWLLITLALALLVLAVDAIRRYATLYQVTTRRIRIRKGILARRNQSTSIGRLQSIDVNQSVLARVLNVGDINFDTAATGEDTADFRFDGVGAPHEMVQVVERALENIDDTRAGMG